MNNEENANAMLDAIATRDKVTVNYCYFRPMKHCFEAGFRYTLGAIAAVGIVSFAARIIRSMLDYWGVLS